MEGNENKNILATNVTPSYHKHDVKKNEISFIVGLIKRGIQMDYFEQPKKNRMEFTLRLPFIYSIFKLNKAKKSTNKK